MKFLLPPRMYNESGEIRKVGFEIEFGGLGLEEAARLIADLYGGMIHKRHQFSYVVTGSQYGDFSLESDSRFLSQKKYDVYLEKMGIADFSGISENLEKILEKLAGTLLPFEIAMPPIPLDQLEAAEKVRQSLYEHSAQGISSSVFAAFGMQFNPEVPDFEVETILSYLRSFFLLYDWLVEESNIVLARKIAPYIHPFPQEYMDLVVNMDYQPDLEQFMSDYLRANPTRNRPLDLLPLFTYMDADLVFEYPVEKKLIKPRPTFHYRLPNSEVDNPNWSFAQEWNKWVRVEELAADSERMALMSEDYLNIHLPSRLFPRSPWIAKTQEWLNAKR